MEEVEEFIAEAVLFVEGEDGAHGVHEVGLGEFVVGGADFVAEGGKFGGGEALGDEPLEAGIGDGRGGGLGGEGVEVGAVGGEYFGGAVPFGQEVGGEGEGVAL